MILLYLLAPGTQETQSSQNSSQCLGVGSTPALLRGGQAKPYGQRVMTRQGPAAPGPRDLEGGCLGQERSNLLQGAALGVSHESEPRKQQGIAAEEFFFTPDGRKWIYCLKVLNLTLNQQLARAVTSPGSAAHLISCCLPHKGRLWGQHLKISPLLPQEAQRTRSGQVRNSPEAGPVQSQCPHRADTPVPIAVAPDAGEQRFGYSNHPLGGFCKAGQNPQKCPVPAGTEGGCSCSQGHLGPRCAASNSAPVFPADL